MHLSRIPGERLTTKRLDADFYRPEYLSIESKLMSLRPCSLGQSGRFFAGPFGSKLPSNLYLDQGVPLFRVGNVGEFEALTDNLAHLDESVHEELRVSEVVPGDLLIVKASVGEKICKVPAWMSRANITQHIIAIRPNGRFDVDYLSAFLFGCYGRKQLQRYSLGSIIQYLGINDARSVLIPNIGPLAQKYIGNKVRQAERLRAWANAMKQDVDSELDELQLPTDTQPKMLNRVEAHVLDQRLDPRPYRTHFQTLVRAIRARNHDHCGALATLSSGCPVASEDFLEGSGVSLIRIRNIRSEGFSGLDVGISESVFKSSPQYQAKTNDIVVGMDGEFRAQFFLEDELPMFVNQRVATIRATKIRPELLAHWLNRPEGQMQLNQWAVKTTVEHTSLPDIARVLIPRIAGDDEGRIADNLLYTRKARFFSGKLTNAAKLLVESLIERQITEPQLIAAQQALEAGDDSLDRAVLARLRTDGLDGTSEPLFPELDQLYDLLERAEREAEA